MRPPVICLAIVLLVFTFTFFVLGQASAVSRALAAVAAPDEMAILEIPLVQGDPPQIDGDCASEYEMAAEKAINYDDDTTASIYFQHDYGYLYVCMEAAHGAFAERFASVYLDPQGDGVGYTFARKDDYGLWAEVLGERRTVQGSDVAGGWVHAPSMDFAWTGVAGTGGNGDFAEWRILRSEFQVDTCELFGIAVYHHSVNSEGDDHGYPSNQWYDQPRTWELAKLAGPECDDPERPQVAYVFRGDTADGTSFYNLLTANNYVVDLIPFAEILATDFSEYDLILIADDSGFLSDWGQTALAAQQVAKITAPVPAVPIIGLGEGGYAFFGQLGLFLGWPNGWHRYEDSALEAASPPIDYYTAGGPLHQLYTSQVNEIGIYLGPEEDIPPDVSVIGLEPQNPDHAPLIRQGCRHLWGYSGNPNEMTADGQQIFLNAVAYMIAISCPRELPPPDTCLEIEKVADPPAGTTVQPGDTIAYTVNYLWSDDPSCRTAKQTTKIIDYVPFDTMFVPGSATGGIVPQMDDALVWTVTPAAGTQFVGFKVFVSDTQCANQQMVDNEARLLVPDAATMFSGIVSHPVECPGIIFPNNGPPYAAENVQVYPYPIIAGDLDFPVTALSVKLMNRQPVATTVIVATKKTADTEPFGIGLSFNTFSQEMVTIPANSNVIVETSFTPDVSGHRSFEIVVQGTNPGDPEISIQRNMDVTEDLQPGLPDDLVFKVGNPTATTADVQLVVDNNCPGWQATVSPALLTDMDPGEVSEATLTVHPPNPIILGSRCHVDVQGWIGDQLIGGIRKLDVPPVHLPLGEWIADVERPLPYMGPGISINPDPPVIGQEAEISVMLQNPLDTPREVTLELATAEFGAGLLFTYVDTSTVWIPPILIPNPAPYPLWRDIFGINHENIQVTLKQDGYHDQVSQRTLKVLEGTMPGSINSDLAFWADTNTSMSAQPLSFDIRTYGLGPGWHIEPLLENGKPVPEVIEGRSSSKIYLMSTQGGDPPPGLVTAMPDGLPEYGFGDQIRIEVDVLIGGRMVGGVAYILEMPEEHKLYLPFISRH